MGRASTDARQRRRHSRMARPAPSQCAAVGGRGGGGLAAPLVAFGEHRAIRPVAPPLPQHDRVCVCMRLLTHAAPSASLQDASPSRGWRVEGGRVDARVLEGRTRWCRARRRGAWMRCAGDFAGGCACVVLVGVLVRGCCGCCCATNGAAVLCARGGPLSTGEHVLLPVSGRLLRPVPFQGIGIANVHLSSAYI